MYVWQNSQSAVYFLLRFRMNFTLREFLFSLRKAKHFVFIISYLTVLE